MGEMAEHIKFCDSAHSKYPDFDRCIGLSKAGEKCTFKPNWSQTRANAQRTCTQTLICTLVLCCYHGDHHSTYSWGVILKKMICRKLGWDTSGYTPRGEI
jgi:hypothetical protein